MTTSSLENIQGLDKQLLEINPNLTTQVTAGTPPLSVIVNRWTRMLCDALESSYDDQFPDRKGQKRFTIEEGRKYYKIKEQQGGVHAFVDKNTGEVYKPASYKSPAKGVRYDLRSIEDRERCLSNADWAGGYLYLR